jgi:hypothetical protein
MVLVRGLLVGMLKIVTGQETVNHIESAGLRRLDRGQILCSRYDFWPTIKQMFSYTEVRKMHEG